MPENNKKKYLGAQRCEGNEVKGASAGILVNKN